MLAWDMSSPENTFITFRGALRKLLSSLLLKCFHGLVVRSRAKVVLYPWGVRIYCFCWLFGRWVSLLVVWWKKKKKNLDSTEKANIFWPKIRKDNKSPLACGKHSSRPGSKRWKHSPVIQDCVVNFTKKVFFFIF